MYSWYKKADSPYYKSKLRSLPKEEIGKDMIRLWNYIKRNKNMTATFYHGTSSIFLAESMKNGYLSAPSVRKASDRENRTSGLDEVFVTTSFSYALYYASRTFEQIRRAEPDRKDNEPVILQLEIPIYMIKEFSDVILRTEQNIYNEYNIPEKIFQIIAEGIRGKYPIELQAENLLNFILQSYNQSDNEFTIKYILPTRFIKSHTLRDRDLLMRIANEYTKHWSDDNKNSANLYSKDVNNVIKLIPESRKNEPWAVDITGKLYVSKIFNFIENYSNIEMETYNNLRKLPNFNNNEIKIKDFIIYLIKTKAKSPSLLLEDNFLDIFSKYKEIYDIYRSFMDSLQKNNPLQYSTSIFNNYDIVSDPKNKDIIKRISRTYYLYEIEKQGSSALLKAYDAVDEYRKEKPKIENYKKEPDFKKKIIEEYLHLYNKKGIYPVYIEEVVLPIESDKEAMKTLMEYMSKGAILRARNSLSQMTTLNTKERNIKMIDLIKEQVEEYAKEEELFLRDHAINNNPINIKINRNDLLKITLGKIRASEMGGQVSSVHEDVRSSPEYQKSLFEYWRDKVQYSLKSIASFPEELSKDVEFMSKFYKYLVKSIEDFPYEISYIPKSLLSDNIRKIACNSFIDYIGYSSLSYLASIIPATPSYILEDQAVRKFCIQFILSRLANGFGMMNYGEDFYKIVLTNDIHHFLDDPKILKSFLNSVEEVRSKPNSLSVKKLYSLYIIDKQNGFKFLNDKNNQSFVEDTIKEAHSKFALSENGGNPFDSGVSANYLIQESFIRERLSQDDQFRKNVILKLFNNYNTKIMQYYNLIALPIEIVNDPFFQNAAINIFKNEKEAENAVYDIRSAINVVKDERNSAYNHMLTLILENIKNKVYSQNVDLMNTNKNYPIKENTEQKNTQASNDNWYHIYKESQFSINDENIDKEKIYNTFKDTYEKSTGKSWSKEKFFNRSGDWRFYGDQNGYISVREQKSGMLKLTGMAGSLKSIIKGLEQLKKEEAPIWGMVTKDIASMANRVGFKSVDAQFVKNNIHNIPSYVFGGAKILSIQDDGGIVFQYSDVGESIKYLIGNDKYISMIEGFSLSASF